MTFEPKFVDQQRLLEEPLQFLSPWLRAEQLIELSQTLFSASQLLSWLPLPKVVAGLELEAPRLPFVAEAEQPQS